MFGVGVADVPAAAEGRDDDQGNARAVSEEIQRLNVAEVLALWHISGEDVVESAVFADQDDDVLDGGTGAILFMLVGLQGCCKRAPQVELEHGQGDESNAQTMQSL